MTARNLHIGGLEPHPDWEILNAAEGSHVDHVGDAAQLGWIEDGAIARIYASHVLEHLGYATEMGPCLHEWFRVLEPGGELRVSVPDLQVLCELFAAPHRTYAERYHLMRILMGGQMDEYDFHRTGFFEELLVDYLGQVGFVRIQRVEEHGLFEDCSSLRLDERLISLNVVAYKPMSQGSPP